MHVFLLCLQDIKSAKKALDNLQFGGYEDLDIWRLIPVFQHWISVQCFHLKSVSVIVCFLNQRSNFLVKLQCDLISDVD